MDRNPDINSSNRPTEQRSSSIDRSAYSSAEAQRAQTTLHPGGTLQSSDIGLGTETMVPRKQQDIPRNVNGFDLFHLNLEQQPTFNDPDKRHTFGQNQETPDVRTRKTSDPLIATQVSPPPRYAANQQRRSVPYDETISFFGDSNAADNKHYPSRSLLDQDGLHRGSIGTLPHAGYHREHRRSSTLSGSGEQQRDSFSTPMHRTSSALSGAGDFLPREKSSTTPAMNDIPIGDKALHPEDKVSAAPFVTGNLPSTHEPAGHLTQGDKPAGPLPQNDQTGAPRSPTVNQGASTHQPLEEGEDRDREKSYTEMASEAAANVTATAKGAIATVATGATAAAAALFGAKNEDEERAKRESNVEPAIHGQEADYDSQDRVRRESIPDDQHPFCKSVHEPVIHGQTACYHCVKTDNEKTQVKPSSAEITGTAAALGAAGTAGTAGAVLVTPDPIGTSTVIEDDNSAIDHILERPTNSAGVQTTDQPTEWAGQPYPATDGVLVADKHNFGLSRPLPPESNNESISSTRAINGDPISEEDEVKQRASTAPTDKTIESPSEHQPIRRSSLTAGLKSKAAAGGAVFASAFRRLSHSPSSPTETDRRVSDAEAFKQQQQQHHHHVHGADKAIDTEKQVNNYAIPEDVMKARENNRQLEEDFGKNYPKKEFTRESTSQSPQVVPTDVNIPYDKQAVGESGFTNDPNRATGRTSTVVADIPFDTVGATAMGTSAGVIAAANADANKALENIAPRQPREEAVTPSAPPEPRTQPATISPTNSTNTWTTAPMASDQQRHAFGGSHAFGNYDIVAPAQQEFAKAPGFESMKVAGTPGQTEGQDNFIKEEDNEQRKSSRKGSIQKVIGKLFHK